jgi:hypothetical protein
MIPHLRNAKGSKKGKTVGSFFAFLALFALLASSLPFTANSDFENVS